MFPGFVLQIKQTVKASENKKTAEEHLSKTGV